MEMPVLEYGCLDYIWCFWLQMAPCTYVINLADIKIEILHYCVNYIEHIPKFPP